jgi:hypothetical protein
MSGVTTFPSMIVNARLLNVSTDASAALATLAVEPR